MGQKIRIKKKRGEHEKMELFEDRVLSFFNNFGEGRKMVLSTSEKNRVSSRMMSVVQINGYFYFQTDKKLRKYHQLEENRNVALCIDNIQIEGVCEELGHPFNHPAFCKAFQECFKGSYDAYSSLKDERLFVVKPLYIERWIYQNGIPFIEKIDLENKHYSFEKYMGE